MSNVYAFIVFHLCTHPLRKFTELCWIFCFTTYSDTSEYRFYFAQCLDVTDSVPGFTAISVYSHKLKNFSKSKKYIRMGFLVLKDHKCLFPSVGKLLNNVVCIPNGSDKMRNISVSYRFQFKIMLFICSYNYLSLFFLP